jgi:hypothetical protein
VSGQLHTPEKSPRYPLDGSFGDLQCRSRGCEEKKMVRSCLQPKCRTAFSLVAHSLHSPAALPQGDSLPSTHWTEGFVNSKDGLEFVEKEKNVLILVGTEPCYNGSLVAILTEPHDSAVLIRSICRPRGCLGVVNRHICVSCRKRNPDSLLVLPVTSSLYRLKYPAYDK